MLPTLVPVQREIDLHERPPFGALRFADEVQAGLERRVVGLARVAGDARADDVFPRRWAAAVARDDVVEVQILSLENLAAILAGVLVALENVVPRELHFLLRHPVIHEEQNDLRHADAERDRVDGFVVRRIGGDVAPFVEAEGAERAVGIVHHHLGLALKKKRERAAGGADIDRLPEPVQNQDMLVKCGFHGATGGTIAKLFPPVNLSVSDVCVTTGAVAKIFPVWHFAAMKLLCLIVLLLAGVGLPAHAQPDADERYLGIYGSLQQADQLAETGDPGEVLAAYQDVQSQFQQFQKHYPTWSPNIVAFRLGQVDDSITTLKSRPGVAAERTTQPAGTAPVKVPPVVAAPPVSEPDALRAQLQSAQATNADLQAKLKEALSVQPAATDPRELQRAQEKIRALMKENDLLIAARATTLPIKVVVQTVTNTVILQVTNQPVPEPMVITNVISVPVSDTNAASVDYDARLRELTQERDDLIEKLAAARQQGSAGKDTAVRLVELNDEVRMLRARLAVDEAAPVPFTAPEIALLQVPAPAPANPDANKKSIHALPAGAAELAASAQRHFAAQELDAAEADYRSILVLAPDNPIALANLATIEMQAGKLDAAEQHITAAVKQTPDDAYNLSTLGNLKYQQGKYDEALDILSRAAQLDPNNPEIQNFLGVTLSHKGQRQAAESALRRAIQMNPDYAPAHNNLAVIYLNQTPPLPGLARWHYQKAVAAGQPRIPELEKLLADKGAPVAP